MWLNQGIRQHGSYVIFPVINSTSQEKWTIILLEEKWMMWWEKVSKLGISQKALEQQNDTYETGGWETPILYNESHRVLRGNIFFQKKMLHDFINKWEF